MEYVATETPMVSYLNMHLALEQLREQAKTMNKQGPRVCMTGPIMCGTIQLVLYDAYNHRLLSVTYNQYRQIDVIACVTFLVCSRC